MADQNIRVTNMPDSGSPEAVALALWRHLRTVSASPEDQLRFYVQCRRATYGNDPK